MQKLLALLALVIITGCVSTPSRTTTAAQNLNSAQVQATNAALEDAAVQSATEHARAQRESASANATQAAINATQIAVDATEQAQMSAYRATVQAQEAAAAQANLVQEQKSANATIQAIDRQMDLDVIAATKQAVEWRATSTVVAKLQADDEGRRSLSKQDEELTFWVGWLVKGGAALLFLIAIGALIEIVRKRGAVSMIGRYPVAVDGGMFGSLEAFLLLPDEQKAPLLLAPPVPAEQAPDQFVVNNTRTQDMMSTHEYNDRQYWRIRATRFLQEAIAVKGQDYKKIPTCREMEMPNPEWVAVTNSLKPWIDKRQGVSTLCIAPYGSLGLLYRAVTEKVISPLPPDLYEKYQQNSYKQVTVEQSGNSEKQSKTAGNSRKQDDNSLADAVVSLPQNEANNGEYED